MKYQKEIAEFKAAIAYQYKENDCTKPKKNSKVIHILVMGTENEQATVELIYDERFYRMWGQHNHAWVKVFEGSLKEACQVARDLKAECGLKITYIEYEDYARFY